MALAFFGDGAANQGNLYESMNMAGIWKLPVIFLCENNLYALSTPAHTVTSGVIASRAAGFDIPGIRVENGQNFLDVFNVVKTAVDRARSGEGPSLIEVVTYRFNEHSEGLRLGVDYRDQDEKAEWLAKDPIAIFRDYLIQESIATADELDALYAEVELEVEEAFEFSQSSPFPDASDPYLNLYTEPFEVYA